MQSLKERQFQQDFIGKLKAAGWHVESEICDLHHNARLDVVAYHRIFDAFFCFELKVPESIKDYTCALRQMIQYRSSQFKYPLDLYCLIIPHSLNNTLSNIVIERFFWRWGFGVGDYESMKIRFVNGEAIATVDILHPQNRFFTPKSQIAEIKRRTHIAWNGEDANKS